MLCCVADTAKAGQTVTSTRPHNDGAYPLAVASLCRSSSWNFS